MLSEPIHHGKCWYCCSQLAKALLKQRSHSIIHRCPFPGWVVVRPPQGYTSHCKRIQIHKESHIRLYKIYKTSINECPGIQYKPITPPTSQPLNAGFLLASTTFHTVRSFDCRAAEISTFKSQGTVSSLGSTSGADGNSAQDHRCSKPLEVNHCHFSSEKLWLYLYIQPIKTSLALGLLMAVGSNRVELLGRQHDQSFRNWDIHPQK